ncbi:MAG: nickel pincer cofactor biosynthesis protein LarC [Thermodesulfobacteriota bacterium]
MSTLYCDCFSGVSGDMFVAAALDLGLTEARLRSVLALLPVSGYEMAVERVQVGGIAATRFRVELTAPQPERSWPVIREILSAASLPAGVQRRALAVFAALAQAEAAVHGQDPEAIHFHELGGVDALVDVVAASLALEELGVTELLASPLPLGRGWVESVHGPLPLPAPATLQLLQGLAVEGVDLAMELVTPTGAAILRALGQGTGPLPSLVPAAVGYGAGTRERPDGRPNLLRLILGERPTLAEAQEVTVLETHLDDWSPEGFPHLCQRLLAAGALDVAAAPLVMKKGRPGFLLRVLAEPAQAWDLGRILLAETTAIGLRHRREGRWTLPRQRGTVPTPWGPVAAKRIETPAGVVLTPEYEACRQLADARQVPLREVYAAVGRCRPEDFSRA